MLFAQKKLCAVLMISIVGSVAFAMDEDRQNCWERCAQRLRKRSINKIALGTGALSGTAMFLGVLASDKSIAQAAVQGVHYAGQGFALVHVAFGQGRRQGQDDAQ